MNILASQLNHKIEVWTPEPFQNDMGEDDTKFKLLKKVPAGITILNGTMRSYPGEMDYSEFTHKITIRKKALPSPSNSMYFMLGGQKYQIKYFFPHYKYKDRWEFYCNLEVEV